MRGLEQIPWLYDLMSAISERMGADVWRDRVVSDARGLTLEVGAGTGRNLSRYPKHARVIALEPDRMVARAARRRAGCHPNRDTEANVEAAGFVIDGPTRRGRGNLRFFHAQPLAQVRGAESPEGSD